MEMSEIRPHVRNDDEYAEQVKGLSKSTGPTFFKLQARVPKRGRTETLVSASSVMTVSLKMYAAGGENVLHRHPNEDHVFIVLSGRAVFFGPNGEMREIGRNSGVFLPRTALYSFRAREEEPLVMLRVGAAVVPGADVNDRVGADAHEIGGFSQENKEVDVVFDGEKVFE
ncbi:MAG: cupin domain-containing protein [Gemmataceae bacterium]